MERLTPIQNEISLDLDDMFFSTTDSAGIILDGNDVFVNISQYSRVLPTVQRRPVNQNKCQLNKGYK